jgi:hypothetical protein
MGIVSSTHLSTGDDGYSMDAATLPTLYTAQLVYLAAGCVDQASESINLQARTPDCAHPFFDRWWDLSSSCACLLIRISCRMSATMDDASWWGWPGFISDPLQPLGNRRRWRHDQTCPTEQELTDGICIDLAVEMSE